jgi:ABC-type bacteriocin/lantibiotic exporter with double-glycine peptidase domain
LNYLQQIQIEIMGLLWFWGWTLALAVALFFPVSNIIWVMSVRRVERRTNKTLSKQERQGQLQRARFIAAFLVGLFAVLFNYNVFGIPS